MCQFQYCKTETKASGYCTICGEEICPDCEDTENPKKHASCTRGGGFGGSGFEGSPLFGFDPWHSPIGPIPGDIPYPE